MKNSVQRALALAAVVALAAVLAACGSNKKKEELPGPEKSEQELRAEAAALYRLARGALDANDFDGAGERYDQLMLRYPFTDYATQAQMERIYALYRNYDSDKAMSAADKFLREHPRHYATDYVQYLKGLISFNREQSVSRMLSLDTTKGDVTNDRRAFDDFALLVQKYPNSRYAGDARLRMIYLRNRIAEHETHVVRFYMSRGAYLAAAKRAEQVVAQYPGAPASYEALGLMEEAYDAAGLTQQAEDVRRIRAAQTPVAAAETAEAPAGDAPPPPTP